MNRIYFKKKKIKIFIMSKKYTNCIKLFNKIINYLKNIKKSFKNQINLQNK